MQHLGAPARRRLADAGGAGPQDAVRADGLGEAVEVDGLVGGDEAHLQLARAAALADDEVAQQPGRGAAVVGAQAALPAPRQRRLARRRCRARRRAGSRRPPRSAPRSRARGSRTRARRRRPSRRSTRACCGSATARRRARSARARSRRGGRCAAARRRPGSALISQLALVGQHLPRRAGVVGARRDALGAGLEHLDGPRLGVRALALGDLGADAVAGHGAADEDRRSRRPCARRPAPPWAKLSTRRSSRSPRCGREAVGRGGGCVHRPQDRRGAAARSAQEPLQQRLLDVPAVLRLLPDALPRPYRTSAVISSPGCAGRQCSAIASGPARSSSASSMRYGASAARRSSAVSSSPIDTHTSV